jgi:hypothetical protein
MYYPVTIPDGCSAMKRIWVAGLKDRLQVFCFKISLTGYEAATHAPTLNHTTIATITEAA